MKTYIFAFEVKTLSCLASMMRCLVHGMYLFEWVMNGGVDKGFGGLGAGLAENIAKLAEL